MYGDSIINEISSIVNELHSVDLSSEDPKQICKSILEDIINDIPNIEETSMYREKPKVNDPHSDGLDELPLSSYEIDDKQAGAELGQAQPELGLEDRFFMLWFEL